MKNSDKQLLLRGLEEAKIINTIAKELEMNFDKISNYHISNGIDKKSLEGLCPKDFYLSEMEVTQIFLLCKYWKENIWDENSNIYFDADGTLYGFLNNPLCPKGEHSKESGYYASLPPIIVALATYRLFVAFDMPVKLLTAVYIDDHSRADKLISFDKYLGMDTDIKRLECVFVNYGENKADYVTNNPNNILIDDHTPNCNGWNGRAIKFINNINNNGKNKENAWKGETVSYKDTPLVFASKILRKPA